MSVIAPRTSLGLPTRFQLIVGKADAFEKEGWRYGHQPASRHKPNSVRSIFVYKPWRSFISSPVPRCPTRLYPAWLNKAGARCDYYPRVPGIHRLERRSISLFCLAPPGVFPAPGFTAEPVGSYPAISPLPGTISNLEHLSSACSVRKWCWAVYFLRHFPSTKACASSRPRFRAAGCLSVFGLSSTPDFS